MARSMPPHRTTCCMHARTVPNSIVPRTPSASAMKHLNLTGHGRSRVERPPYATNVAPSNRGRRYPDRGQPLPMHAASAYNAETGLLEPSPA